MSYKHYITLYLDIGRSQWNTFSRSFEEYMHDFLPFIQLFKENNHMHILYIFIDKKYASIIQDKTLDITNIHVISIDTNWLKLNSKIWNMLPKEKEIMESETYKELMGERIKFPEHHIPEYTIINHLKIDLVNYVINMNMSMNKYIEFYTWVDFGYFKKKEYIPDKLLDVFNLDCHRINYTLINPLDDRDNDTIFTLKNAPEKVAGYFFSGIGKKLIDYKHLYHSVLQDFQEQGYADDDQHIVLRCYYKNPNLFKFHHLGQWHMALVRFQQKTSQIEYYTEFNNMKNKMISVLDIDTDNDPIAWKNYFCNSVIYKITKNVFICNYPGIHCIIYNENTLENILYKKLSLIKYDIILVNTHTSSFNDQIYQLLKDKLRNDSSLLILENNNRNYMEKYLKS